jgi:hypothetical protein
MNFILGVNANPGSVKTVWIPLLSLVSYTDTGVVFGILYGSI